MESFCPKSKRYELEFKGKLYVMTMQNDAKFEEELTCQFNTDMRNLLNFDPSTETISKICALMGCFSPKYLSLKSTVKLCLMALRIDVKFKGKLTCALKVT